MARPFVIVGTQRTGTTLIRTSLDSHPDLICSGEVFKGGRRPYKHPDGYWFFCRATLLHRIRHYVARKRNVSEFLSQLLSRHGAAAIGFKLMFSHARRYPEVVEFIKTGGLSVVHVTRRNVLKTLISRDVARATGVYHRTAESTERGQAAISLDPMTLVERLDGVVREEQAWDSLLRGHPALIKVCYEDFVNDREVATQRLLNFLGLGFVELNSPLQRLSPSDMRLIIANYDDVAAVLQATPYRSLLEGDEVRDGQRWRHDTGAL